MEYFIWYVVIGIIVTFVAVISGEIDMIMDDAKRAVSLSSWTWHLLLAIAYIVAILLWPIRALNYTFDFMKITRK